MKYSCGQPALSFIVGVVHLYLQVNQKAQQTSAGQLSRNLLLAPKATVNVKPNLMVGHAYIQVSCVEH